MFRRTAFLKTFLFLLAPVALAGCGFSGFLDDQAKVTEETTKSFTVQAKPEVIAKSFNGKIEVIAGPSEEKVEVKVTKQAGGESDEAARENLKDIVVTMQQEGKTIRITAEVAKGARRANRGAAIEVQVPQATTLDLSTSNGKITSTGPAGDITAHTSNGEVNVKGGQGKIDLQSSNGALIVEGGKGQLDLKTSNGRIEAASNNSVVNAQTSNGAIHFKGKLADGEHSFHSSNGQVSLDLAPDSTFEIDAGTSNSQVETDFPVGRREGSKKNRLRGTVGENPQSKVKVHTSNGRIKIMQDK